MHSHGRYLCTFLPLWQYPSIYPFPFTLQAAFAPAIIYPSPPPGTFRFFSYFYRSVGELSRRNIPLWVTSHFYAIRLVLYSTSQNKVVSLLTGPQFRLLFLLGQSRSTVSDFSIKQRQGLCCVVTNYALDEFGTLLGWVHQRGIILPYLKVSFEMDSDRN